MLSTVFDMTISELCPTSAPFFGFMGVAASIIFASRSIESSNDVLDLGSAYGTAKAGVGVCSMGVFRPDAVMKNMLPVIMAGILGIYGLIASIIMVYVSRVHYWRSHSSYSSWR